MLKISQKTPLQYANILSLCTMSSCILLNLSVKLSSMFHLISARRCCSQVLWMVASDGVNKRAGLNLNEPLSCSAGNSPLQSKRLAKAIQAHISYQHVPLKEIYLFRATQRVVMYAEHELDLFSCSTEAAVWMSELQTALGSRRECLISLYPLVQPPFCVYQYVMVLDYRVWGMWSEMAHKTNQLREVEEEMGNGYK